MRSAAEIGARLKELRGDTRREDVAKAVQIGVSAITMYELGQRVPRDEVKERLANYYGVGLEELFYGPQSTERG